MNKLLIGLAQALAVAVYCGLVAWFLRVAGNYFNEPVGVLGTALILVLLVFSAAVSGSIVFAYPAYLILNKRTKEGLSVLGYTFIFCLIIMLIILAVLFL